MSKTCYFYFYLIIKEPKFIIPVVIRLITGEIIIPVIPVIHNTTNNIENNCSLLINHVLTLVGKNGIIIFEPSNGGNGIKLKTPKPILIDIVDEISNNITFPTVEVKNVIPAYLYIA